MHTTYNISHKAFSTSTVSYRIVPNHFFVSWKLNLLKCPQIKKKMLRLRYITTYDSVEVENVRPTERSIGLWGWHIPRLVPSLHLKRGTQTWSKANTAHARRYTTRMWHCIIQCTQAKVSHLVTSLPRSRQQDVFALLVTSCQQFKKHNL
jgi:hypothetical protein